MLSRNRPERDRHRQRGKGDLPRNAALAPLVDADVHQFVKKRAHRNGNLLIRLHLLGRQFNCRPNQPSD